MAKQLDALTPHLQGFIERQPLFFVATAAPQGRVNLSPKGIDSLRVLGTNRVAWLNVTGSGNETAAHLLQSPRMTLMFCSFEGPPLILRLYGAASMIQPDGPGWDAAIQLFPPLPGARQVYVLDIDLVQTSCGMAVPVMEFVAPREDLNHWAEQKGPEDLETYRQTKNRFSIDDFPTRLPARTLPG